MKREVRPDQHGTKTGYVYGCRCVECTAAQRAASRAWRKVHPNPVRVVREGQHGTRTGYIYGCRCRPCTDVWAEWQRVSRTGVGIEFYTDHATRDEVRQWARGLGLPISASMSNRTDLMLIARWNREHPDRPYVRADERRNEATS